MECKLSEGKDLENFVPCYISDTQNSDSVLNQRLLNVECQLNPYIFMIRFTNCCHWDICWMGTGRVSKFSKML